MSEKERESVCERANELKRVRGSVQESECVCVCARECVRERKSKRERERA